jgi:hypothetical protein
MPSSGHERMTLNTGSADLTMWAKLTATCTEEKRQQGGERGGRSPLLSAGCSAGAPTAQALLHVGCAAGRASCCWGAATGSPRRGTASRWGARRKGPPPPHLGEANARRHMADGVE